MSTPYLSIGKHTAAPRGTRFQGVRCKSAQFQREWLVKALMVRPDQEKFRTHASSMTSTLALRHPRLQSPEFLDHTATQAVTRKSQRFVHFMMAKPNRSAMLLLLLA
jgi:hypothetical protein